MKLRMITSDTVQHSLEHSVHQSLCKSQAIILMMMISFCIFKEWHIVRRFNLHSTKDHSFFTRACIKLSHVRTNKTLFTGVKECFKRRMMCVPSLVLSWREKTEMEMSCKVVYNPWRYVVSLLIWNAHVNQESVNVFQLSQWVFLPLCA